MATKTWTGATDTAYTTAGNWSGGAAPTAGDDVVFTTGTNAPAGSDQSGTELGSITFRQMGNQTGSESAYLQLDVANGGAVNIEAQGVVYLDLGNAAVSVTITDTATPAAPGRGVYLKGTALVNVTVRGSSRVRLVGTTLTGNLYVENGSLVETDDGCTVVDVDAAEGGEVLFRGVVTDLRATGGTIHRYSSDNVVLMGAYKGGLINDFGGGTVSEVEAFGGVVDAAKNAVARTYTTVEVDNSGTLRKSAQTTVSAITAHATITAG